MNDNDDETARAVAAIEDQLNSFKSPLLGKTLASQKQTRGIGGEDNDDDVAMNDPYYPLNPMQWYQQELEEDPPMPVKTPRRTPLLERAGTPVMSNSTASRSLKAISGISSSYTSNGRNTYGLNDENNEGGSDDDDHYTEPRPVETPLQRRFKTASSSSSKLTSRGIRGISEGIAGGSGVTAMVTIANNPSSASLKQYTFRKYHDALLGYLDSKRHIDHRIDLERRERDLEQQECNNDVMMDMNSAFTSASASLSQDECRTEVDYCKALFHIGHSLPMNDEASTEEGYFWNLLLSLRKLSLSALIWHDDSTSLTQHSSSLAFYLQQLTSNIHSTPKELVETMATSVSSSSISSQLPLILQRKNELLSWIQFCLGLESKSCKGKLMISGKKSNSGTGITIQSCSHPDDPRVPSLISEMDGKLLKTMIQVCLALILEGRTSDALEIARSQGQSWRAAAWIGGQPFGYSPVIKDDTKSVDNIPVGNPNQFLWKRQVWKSGRRLLQKQQNQELYHRTPTSSSSSSFSDIKNEEAAIYSILADDVTSSLDNPCIRFSWTKSLCVLLMGIRGRTQDEVLHRHNSNRRRNVGNKVFPGCQYKKEEDEQLMATANLSTMTEAQIASILTNSHFLRQQEDKQREMNISPRRRFSYKSAIMSFVRGRSAILQFCSEETSKLVSDLREISSLGNSNDHVDDDYVNQDWEGVRFMTHLMLFLDSLQDSSTPVVLDGVREQKNQILFEYVQYLESRPDLWQMITLYVSLLPEPKIQEYYPTVLVKVLDESERKKMLGQIRHTIPHLELPLLRKVVRLSLSAPSGSVVQENEEVMDKIKCNSLQWMLHQDGHMGDALICANILLRDFLLNEEEDKTYVAMNFMNECLPESFLELVSQSVDKVIREEVDENRNILYNLGMDRTVYMTKIDNATREYMAFMSYLDAYSSFENWKEILRETPTVLEDHQLPDATNLNETEQSVAKSNFLRGWIKEKKKHVEKTLNAAEAARLSLHNVLTHPGGWLSVDEDELANIDLADKEEQKRQRDTEKIRSRHLVLAVNLYHQVCEETASWLSRSVNDTENIHLPRDEVLHLLQEPSSGSNISPTPTFWYQHALDLATLVASDTNGISKAFPPNDLKDLLTKLAETAISKLMNV